MNIAVRVPNWIGDCVMCLPALRALKDNCPRDNILLVTQEHLSEVFKNIEGIKEIITIPGKIKAGNLFKVAGELKKHTFDAGILFTNSFNSAFLFRLSGIKPLTGYTKDLRGFLLNKKRKFPGNEDKSHHIFFYQGLVEAFLDKKIEKKYSDELVITKDEKKEVTERITSRFGVDLSKTILGISPSAAYGSAKQWLPERFVELLRRIVREKEASEILLFGSAKEREETAKICEQVGNGRICNLAGELTLREAIIVISLCNLFISNDSGLMHVASSLRVPLIAIFGPTIPHKTSPLSPKAKVFYHPTACAPCKHRDCPSDHTCMKAVTVAEVYDKVNESI
jgi:heptosyltransferase-2